MKCSTVFYLLLQIYYLQCYQIINFENYKNYSLNEAIL